MQTYLTMLDHILTHGKRRENRTGVDTIGVFGYQARFDLKDGFPLLTTKRLYTRGIVGELLWFLRGEHNVRSLQEQNIKIWDEWSDPETGELGPVYGKQWRSWSMGGAMEGYAVDQIATLVRDLTLNPMSRRMIVSGWNVPDVPKQALPPCHTMFQFYVDDGRLSCQLYQRSADSFLGVPFNIASYALLTHILARQVGLDVGEFVHTFGDLHLYTNHISQAREQLFREPRQLPALRIAEKTAAVDVRSIPDAGDLTSLLGRYDTGRPLSVLDGQVISFDGVPVDPDNDVLPNYEISDFAFDAYDPHPSISAPVAV